ncbi:MAG: hypothetical protein WAV46_02945 [Candidatus Moraniibacteriota bacterium]
MYKSVILMVFLSVGLIAQASSENLAHVEKTAAMPICPQHPGIPPAPAGLEFDLRAPGGARPAETEQGQVSPSFVDPNTVTLFPKPAIQPSTKEIDNEIPTVCHP